MRQQGGVGGGERGETQLVQVQPKPTKEREKPKPRPNPMDGCMRDSMRQLALWYTRTFKPMMNHDELEPIMATLGFISLPPSSSATAVPWKEYVYCGRLWKASEMQTPPQQPPRARLPYPRIDGLHINTYRAFLDAVNFFLEMSDISDLFHIRGMPLHKDHEKQRWTRMEEDENIFVYRDGTLDQVVSSLYQKSNNDNGGNNNVCNSNDSVLIRSKIKNTPTGDIVPLCKIIVL